VIFGLEARSIEIWSEDQRLRELFIVCLSHDCMIIYCYVKSA